MKFLHNLNAVTIIAYRDLVKFLKDKARIFSSLVFPIVFIGILGGSSQSSFGNDSGFSYLAFLFTGVLVQTMFQSTSAGIVWLIEDRENDFSQELFVSPISRYSILLGKIVGESTISMFMAIGIIIFGLIMQVPLTLNQYLLSIPVMILACLYGGAFGVLVLSNLGSQRSANQIFPFIIFPQIFLAGVFAPIQFLPQIVQVFAKVLPLTYVVDLGRHIIFFNTPEYSQITLFPVWVDAFVLGISFIIFLVIGTWLFVRNEKNR